MTYGAHTEQGHPLSRAPRKAEKQGVHPSFEKTKVCEPFSKSLWKCSPTQQQREESVPRRPATRGLLDRLFFLVQPLGGVDGQQMTRGPR